MAFDYKKEYKEFYLPAKKPALVSVPAINYVAVKGSGNPNDEGGDYQQAISLLYGIAYTIRMSAKSNWNIDGFFEYVVPPLEGLWNCKCVDKFNEEAKNEFQWISMIRLPEFVSKDVFNQAVATATKKKQVDFSKAEYFTYDEGLCVQCMHLGPYDKESATIDLMKQYSTDNGYSFDYGTRLHHEIYLSDLRRCQPEKIKTVLRIPIKKN